MLSVIKDDDADADADEVVLLSLPFPSYVPVRVVRWSFECEGIRTTKENL